MADRPEDAKPTPVLPAMAAFGTCGILAMGFGAGYGMRAYEKSAAFKDLMEKFPEAPTAEAEALARTGATRALALGTGLAGLMGVGALMVARSYGIKTIDDFAEEARRLLPARQQLKENFDRLEPLQRTISETMQSARNSTAAAFEKSSVGQSLKGQVEKNLEAQTKELQPWEKDLIKKIDDASQPAPKS